MKRFYLAIIFSMIYVFAFSQTNNGCFEASFGPSIPIGNFGSSNINSDYSGFATTGFVYNLIFSYKLGKYFGIIGSYREQSNNFNNAAIEESLSKMNPSIAFDVRSNAWKINGFMIGAFGLFPLKENTHINFETRAIIGFQHATSPAISTVGTQGYLSAWTEQQSAPSNALSYLLSMGFKYKTNKTLCVFITINYFNSEPEFDNVKMTSSTNSTLFEHFKQNMGTVNVEGGIGLNL